MPNSDDLLALGGTLVVPYRRDDTHLLQVPSTGCNKISAHVLPLYLEFSSPDTSQNVGYTT